MLRDHSASSGSISDRPVTSGAIMELKWIHERLQCDENVCTTRRLAVDSGGRQYALESRDPLRRAGNCSGEPGSTQEVLRDARMSL